MQAVVTPSNPQWAQLTHDIQAAVSAIEAAQQTLKLIHDQKSEALAGGKPDQLLVVIEEEERAVSAFKAAIEMRSQLLERACLQGVRVGSLGQLAGAIGDPLQGSLQTRIQRIQVQATELQRSSWIHWVIANRGYHHCREILEIIEFHGRGAPTYEGTTPNPRSGSGGAFLDAAV